MKWRFYILGFYAILLFTSSCTEVATREVWINKDETGRLALSFDNELDVESFQEGLRDRLGIFGFEESDGMYNGQIGIANLLELIGEEDSLLIAYELIDNSKLLAVYNPSQELLKLTLDIKYDSVQVFRHILDSAIAEGSLNAEDDSQLDMIVNQLSNFIIDYHIDSDNNILTIPQFNIFNTLDQLGSLDPEIVDLMDELIDYSDQGRKNSFSYRYLLKIIGNRSEELVFHLPGKIVFSNHTKATISDSTIIFKSNIFDEYLDFKNNVKKKDMIVKYD